MVFAILGFGKISFGSEPQRCLNFVSTDKQFFLLGDAYKVSELVVTGQVLYKPNPVLII